MYVIKRDGNRAPVMFDKISSRIQRLCYGLNEEFVDYIAVSQKVCQYILNIKSCKYLLFHHIILTKCYIFKS